MSDDKIEEIRERHSREDRWRYSPSPQMHDDRAFLLVEVDRLHKAHQAACEGGDLLRADNERLTGKLKLVANALNETISKYHEVGDQNDRLDAENERLRAALMDMLAGWRYIRETYGDLAGIGWDRAESKARNALEGKP